MNCSHCHNTGWVCESHFGRPWSGPSACGCGDAGVPCSCNPNAEYEFDVVYAEVDGGE